MGIEDKKYNLTSITWPIFVQYFFGLLMGNVNVFMLGHLSDKAVGAVGVANQLIGMLNIIYNVIGLGTAILVTQYIGSENLKMSKKVSEISIFLNTLFGIVFSLIFIILGKSLLKLMNLPEEMIPYGSAYIKIVGGSSFLQAVILTLSAILRSFGHTKLPLKVTLLTSLINVIGNFIALFRPFGIPVLGVEGVAVSVLLSNLIGLIIIVYITSRNLNIRFKLRNFISIDMGIVKMIIKVGGPAAGEYISYSFSQLVVTYIITALGTGAINTRIYIQNITSFVSILSFSIGQGTQIIIGFMKGAGKLKEMNKTCMKSLRMGTVFNLAAAVLIYLFSRSLLSLFTSDTSIIETGRMILLIDIFLEIGRAFNHIVGSSLRGTGDVRYPVIISVFSMWFICVLLSSVFGIYFRLGLAGIWIASGMDEWFRGLVLLKRWASGNWEKICIIPVEVL